MTNLEAVLEIEAGYLFGGDLTTDNIEFLIALAKEAAMRAETQALEEGKER